MKSEKSKVNRAREKWKVADGKRRKSIVPVSTKLRAQQERRKQKGAKSGQSFEKEVMKRVWDRFRECLLGHSAKSRDVDMQTVASILNKNNKASFLG